MVEIPETIHTRNMHFHCRPSRNHMKHALGLVDHAEKYVLLPTHYTTTYRPYSRDGVVGNSLPSRHIRTRVVSTLETVDLSHNLNILFHKGEQTPTDEELVREM